MNTKNSNNDKKALGRGLSDLISEATVNFVNKQNKQENDVIKLTLNKIVFNPQQPRKNIDHYELEDLTSSIKEHGILQPILVREVEDNLYQIIAGERRYHAAKKAGLQEIPVIIKNLNECDSLEVAIVENVQRQDLSALEEANAYKKLLDAHGHTQETLAKKLGKSRSYIANTIRLTKLPESVKELLNQNKLTAGHARAILNSEDPIELSRTIIENNLSVRDTERLIKRINNKDNPNNNSSKEKNKVPVGEDAELINLENKLTTELKMKVKIKNHDAGCKVTITCKDLDDFDLIIAKLNNNNLF